MLAAAYMAAAAGGRVGGRDGGEGASEVWWVVASRGRGGALQSSLACLSHGVFTVQNSGPSTQASSTAMSPSTSGLPPQHQMSSAALYVPRSLGGPASAADGGDSSRRGGDASFGGLLQGGFGGGGGLGLGSMGGRVGSVGTLMLPPAKSRVWPRGALLAARRSSGMGSSGSLGQVGVS